jgi:FdhD protein
MHISRGVASTRIIRFRGGEISVRFDDVVVEEPLEIRVYAHEGGVWRRHSVAVTMRTPGDDFELALGFLASEGIIASRDDVLGASSCTESNEPVGNVVNVFLSPRVVLDPARLSRVTYTSSSCGLCGKSSIGAVRLLNPRKPVGDFQVEPEVLLGTAEEAQRAQGLFRGTGGLHAAALFDPAGRLLAIREDVGRHNAVDKLVGHLLLENRLPASNTVLLLSGRAGFELIQKAVVAGIPFVASVGAPSSSAIELAREYGLTLVGFLRGDRFNIYSGEWRIRLGAGTHG